MIGGNHGDSGEDIQSVDGQVLQHQNVLPDISVSSISNDHLRASNGVLESSEEVGPVKLSDVDEVKLQLIFSLTKPSTYQRECLIAFMQSKTVTEGFE